MNNMLYQAPGPELSINLNGTSDQNSFIPTVVEETSRGARTVDVLSAVFNNRIVQLWDVVTDQSVYAARAQLLYLDSLNDEDITLYINSGGGSVSAGLALFATIKSMRSDVVTVAEGLVASMGAFFLTCCASVGKRYVMPFTQVMFHDTAWGLPQQKTKENLKHVHQSERIKAQLFQIISEYTGQPVPYLIDCFDNGDFYLTPEQAVAFGAADHVVEIPQYHKDLIAVRERLLKEARELKVKGINFAGNWSDETLRQKVWEAKQSNK